MSHALVAELEKRMKAVDAPFVPTSGVCPMRQGDSLLIAYVVAPVVAEI